jgi:RNA polymerase sigma-70 factor, ECF subfamily
MPDARDPDTEELLARARHGDDSAIGRLLDRHRGRLKQMIAVRMDTRLAARLDPSDVVQDTLLTASRRLDAYLRDRPLPFYPWLRQIAMDRLVHVYSRHVKARRRSVSREARLELPFSGRSVMLLADRFTTGTESPSRQLARKEQRQRVRQALDELNAGDREVLVLRCLEQLRTREVAAILGISEGAVRMRQLRALERLRSLLDDMVEG